MIIINNKKNNKIVKVTTYHDYHLHRQYQHRPHQLMLILTWLFTTITLLTTMTLPKLTNGERSVDNNDHQLTTLTILPVQLMFQNNNIVNNSNNLADLNRIKSNTIDEHAGKLSNVSLDDYQKDNQKLRERLVPASNN